MSDELALLTAIIANPVEDTPRLIFADWLDENGFPERAEFIRVQIEITREPETQPYTPHYRQRLTRFRELVVAHAAEWVKPLGVAQPQAIFRRGFVEELRLTATQLLKIGDAALCRETLSFVEIYPPRDEDIDEDEDSDAGPPGDAVLRRLATWPGRGRFRTLSVRRLALTPAAVNAFVNSPPAAKLGTLDIEACSFPAGAVRAVAASANLPELNELRLGHCELDAADVLALARAPHLTALRYVMIRVAGADEPDAPGDLRDAVSELHRRYRHVRGW